MFNLRARKSSEGCPLCKSPLAGGGPLRTCAKCSTTFHEACEREFGGGCPTAGCAGSSRRRPRARAERRREEQAETSGLQGEVLSCLALIFMSFGVFLLVAAPALMVVERRHRTAGRVGLVIAILLVAGGFALHPARRWRQ